jgi:hypothetical protein
VHRQGCVVEFWWEDLGLLCENLPNFVVVVVVVTCSDLLFCVSFLGAFIKLRNSTISFVMSVCPSVRTNNSAPLPPDRFSLILTFEKFRKSVETTQVSLKSGKNSGTVHERLGTFVTVKGNFKAIPIQVWTDPQGSRRVMFPKFQDIRLMEMVRLSA